MLKTRKQFLVAFLSLILCAQYSCKKDTTEPIDNSSLSTQMYTIGAKSVTSDIIQTTDGGYLIIGTSYANNDPEGDIVAIKTDARGLLQWSTLMGKASEPGSGSLAGKTVRYDEKGVKAQEEADGSFTIAGNRTYNAYTGSTSGVRAQTKIVFYQLSSTGVASNTDGFELRKASETTDQISDFKIEASSGSSQYILTGYTTDIAQNKPGDPNNGSNDLTDILTILLDNNFNLLWSPSSLAYGFSGKDYGTSIQILPNSYLVVGTMEKDGGTSSYTEFAAVALDKSSGAPISPNYFGDPSYDVEGGYSVYNATNQTTTILGNIRTGSRAGELVVFQLDANLTPQSPNPNNTNTNGFEFIDPSGNSNTFKANSIAQIPNNGGFAISSTMTENLGKDICISKLANDFSLPTTGWPHYYTVGTISTSQHWAGPVIPIVNVNGTEEYVYTGTFNANLSASQIGWASF